MKTFLGLDTIARSLCFRNAIPALAEDIGEDWLFSKSVIELIEIPLMVTFVSEPMNEREADLV
jgi:hypothetical protein